MPTPNAITPAQLSRLVGLPDAPLIVVPKVDRLFVAKRAGLLGSKGAILVFRPEDRTD